MNYAILSILCNKKKNKLKFRILIYRAKITKKTSQQTFYIYVNLDKDGLIIILNCCCFSKQD